MPIITGYRYLAVIFISKPSLLIIYRKVTSIIPDDLAVLAAVHDGPPVQATHHAQDIRLPMDRKEEIISVDSIK
jgi:hypothetical protein